MYIMKLLDKILGAPWSLDIPAYRTCESNVHSINCDIGRKQSARVEIQEALIKYMKVGAECRGFDYFKCIENIHNITEHYFRCNYRDSKEFPQWLEHEYKGKQDPDAIVNTLNQVLAWLDYIELKLQQELEVAKIEYAKAKAEYDEECQKRLERSMEPPTTFENVRFYVILFLIIGIIFYSCLK
jgi:hypothetical protein